MSFMETLGRMISAGISTALFYYITKTFQVEITDFEYFLVFQLTFMTNILMYSDLCSKKRGKR